jgi:hypothetical protein
MFAPNGAIFLQRKYRRQSNIYLHFNNKDNLYKTQMWYRFTNVPQILIIFVVNNWRLLSNINFNLLTLIYSQHGCDATDLGNQL